MCFVECCRELTNAAVAPRGFSVTTALTPLKRAVQVPAGAAPASGRTLPAGDNGAPAPGGEPSSARSTRENPGRTTPVHFGLARSEAAHGFAHQERVGVQLRAGAGQDCKFA